MQDHGDLINLYDYEHAARAKLPREIYDYFAGGANDEITVKKNPRAYDKVDLQHRILRGVSQPELSIQLFGQTVSMPVLIAPTAFHRLAHPEGERATARAAAKHNTIMIVSMAATISLEEVAAAAKEVIRSDPQLWFQIYIQPDLDFTCNLIRRAEASGFGAIVLTVDSPVFGQRERDMRNHFHDLPEGLCLENFTPSVSITEPPPGLQFKSDLSWTDVEWLKSVTALPVLLKGVVHPDDAQLAVEHGADGIIVSNHGGRQLDSAPSTIEVLPEIVNRISGQIPVLVDGGISRGSDVIKALALGADAVAVGRSVLWGLAIDGEAGVAHVLDILRSELDNAMTLCGCATVTDIDHRLIWQGNAKSQQRRAFVRLVLVLAITRSGDAPGAFGKRRKV